MSPGSAFLQFWWTDVTRDAFLSHLTKDDLLNLRLVCHDFSIRTAPQAFSEVNVSFRSSTFTRPARMAALERIGPHIKTLTFDMPHSPHTFLPPLLDPVTGEERIFNYTPLIQTAPTGSRLSIPKYGSWELTDLLIKQYPPLFHAATDIPSFIRAFKSMPCLKHLKISCPNQALAQRYRRDAVDYALISLRIAVEQAPLIALDTLSLLPVHPAAVLYLRPNMGYGATPAATKRWAQIRKLNIHMDAFPYGGIQATDHLKLLHSYLQIFPSLTRFFFRWRGAKGPCPLSLPTEPCLTPSPSGHVSHACPTRSARSLRDLKFPKLRYMELENAILDASQISTFIVQHRRTIREFDFEDVILRSGTWDEALAPLTRISGSDHWKQKQEEVMDVPIMLSPVGMEKGQIEKVLWEEEKRKDKLKNFGAFGSLQRAGSKTREMFWGSPDHMKRFLRTSVFSWR
jgi:hypothetical protein